MKILFVPARVVRLPEAGCSLTQHAAPVLTNPRQRFLPVAGFCHRTNHVVVVIRRDDQPFGASADLRKHMVPDSIILLRSGRTPDHSRGVRLPSRAEGSG